MPRMDDGFKEFVIEQLSELEGLAARRMFGGWGLYADKIFFGIISGGRLYFKTNEMSRGEHIKRNMMPFRVSEQQILKNYYEVPIDITEDASLLVVWARTATKT